MNLADDCPEQDLEAARRRAFYARSSAAVAERLLFDHAIGYDEYLRRQAVEKHAQRCLDKWVDAERPKRAFLVDGEQVGLD